MTDKTKKLLIISGLVVGLIVVIRYAAKKKDTGTRTTTQAGTPSVSEQYLTI